MFIRVRNIVSGMLYGLNRSDAEFGRRQDPLATRKDAMAPQDLVLLIASDAAGRENEQYPLDRVRLQKAVFLATQRGSDAWKGLYTYRPYDWGPYSQELRNDADHLTLTRMLRTEQSHRSRYRSFRTTAVGEARAERVWATLTPKERTFIKTLRQYVTSKSFNHLLREVYAAYPSFATESRFSG